MRINEIFEDDAALDQAADEADPKNRSHPDQAEIKARVSSYKHQQAKKDAAEAGLDKGKDIVVAGLDKNVDGHRIHNGVDTGLALNPHLPKDPPQDQSHMAHPKCVDGHVMNGDEDLGVCPDCNGEGCDESLDEISTELVGRYSDAAKKQYWNTEDDPNWEQKFGDDWQAKEKALHRHWNREAGLGLADDKINGKAKVNATESDESENIDEKAPKGWEGTVKAMKHHSEIDNPWALANWEKNQGHHSHRGPRGGKKKESMEQDVQTEDRVDELDPLIAGGLTLGLGIIVSIIGNLPAHATYKELLRLAKAQGIDVNEVDKKIVDAKKDPNKFEQLKDAVVAYARKKSDLLLKRFIAPEQVGEDIPDPEYTVDNTDPMTSEEDLVRGDELPAEVPEHSEHEDNMHVKTLKIHWESVDGNSFEGTIVESNKNAHLCQMENGSYSVVIPAKKATPQSADVLKNAGYIIERSENNILYASAAKAFFHNQAQDAKVFLVTKINEVK